MSTARDDELRASLQRELDCQPATTRLAWLLEQMENYVERWLALRVVAANSNPPTDDLFRMIVIGAEVTSAELQAAGDAAATERWEEFLAVLVAVRAGSDGVEPKMLRETLGMFVLKMGPRDLR